MANFFGLFGRQLLSLFIHALVKARIALAKFVHFLERKMRDQACDLFHRFTLVEPIFELRVLIGDRLSKSLVGRINFDLSIFKSLLLFG